MSNSILSQEEIDALLRGQGTAPTAQPAPFSAGEAPGLTPEEIDALGEIGNIAMGSSATALSTLLGKRVSITVPRVAETTPRQLQSQYPIPFVVVRVQYTTGVQGNTLLVVKQEDASVIADLMMGGDGHNPSLEIGEIALSAVGEAMNQMMGSSTTSLSSMFNKRIEISPPSLEVISLADESIYQRLHLPEEKLVQISFRVEIENLLDSELMQIIPVHSAREMVELLLGNLRTGRRVPARPAAPPPAESPPLAAAPPPAPAYPPPAVPPSPPASAAVYPPAAAAVSDPPRIIGPEVTVQPVHFAPLSEAAAPREPGNIGLIMDVALQVTVELGRTRKKIKDILEMGPGYVIQLDKMAGEPVDLLVNGKLIAKGEVVVIDENYGLRITAIISPTERVNQLQ
ncbi:MAG: flagellar motor switch phosphatase FliY [Syntrophomonadaceae bacterium]|nr:flagellar motor switch phosphatase FliY [Syntrophomonadaceae bacterium]